MMRVDEKMSSDPKRQHKWRVCRNLWRIVCGVETVVVATEMVNGVPG